MIIKILEEMRQVRLDKDYKNYRTLSDILIEYVGNEILSLSNKQIGTEQLEKTKVIIKWLDSELTYVKAIVEHSLLNKDYADFKVMAQVDGHLKRLRNNLEYIIINKA